MCTCETEIREAFGFPELCPGMQHSGDGLLLWERALKGAAREHVYVGYLHDLSTQYRSGSVCSTGRNAALKTHTHASRLAIW